MIVGIEDSIRYRTKLQAMKKLYKKAKNNPFTDTESFDSYMKFIANKIREGTSVEVQSVEPEEIFDTLKKIGWLRERSYASFYMITTNKAIAQEVCMPGRINTRRIETFECDCCSNTYTKTSIEARRQEREGTLEIPIRQAMSVDVYDQPSWEVICNV